MFRCAKVTAILRAINRQANRRRRYAALVDGEGPGDGRNALTPYRERAAVGGVIGRVNPPVGGIGPPDGGVPVGPMMSDGSRAIRSRWAK